MASGYAGVTLAEVYVMRKLHKEKMKKLEEEQTEKGHTISPVKAAKKETKSSSSTGCYLLGFKKKKHHPAKVSSLDSEEKHVQEKEEF